MARRTVIVELTIDVDDEDALLAASYDISCFPGSLSGTVLDVVSHELRDLPGARVRASAAHEQTAVTL